MALHVLEKQVPELNSWELYANLSQEDGTPIGPANLTTLTMTLYDYMTSTVINGVEDVNILNTGRGQLDANGHLIVSFTSSDNPLVSTAPRERHRARITSTWNLGNGRHDEEFEFTVYNLTGPA
jgi:hypothetical protein